MKANKFRINNEYSIYGSTGKLVSLNIDPFGQKSTACIALEEGGYTCGVLDHFEPIPLTEEWLLRFGFKKNEPEISDGYFNWWNKEKSVSVDVEYVLTDNGVELLYYYVLQDINGCRPYKHIIYVHQLQNLYFALTGQELIKEA